MVIEEAVELLCERAVPITQTETLPLNECIGRITAKAYAAIYDQPPFPRSPLDGYALRSEDIAGASKENPAKVRVIGNVYAGEIFNGTVKKGEAVRITTGAPIPAGADTIVRQERTDRGSDSGAEFTEVYTQSEAWSNYCYQGEDYKAGTELIGKGVRIGGAEAAVLSSMGYAEALVLKKPRISIFTCGDEVLSPGQELKEGKIYDSNLHYILGRLKELNIDSFKSGHCPDEPEKMAQMIRDALEESDIIVTAGGVSVGEKDIMHETIRLLGAEKLFWRIMVKPGSPTLAAACGDKLIICLSGNPFGAAANFELLVRPVLAKLSSDNSLMMKKKKAVIQNSFHKQAKIKRFLRGFYEDGKVWTASGNHSSGAISSLLGCNCMLEIPPEQEGAVEGTEITVHLL